VSPIIIKKEYVLVFLLLFVACIALYAFSLHGEMLVDEAELFSNSGIHQVKNIPKLFFDRETISLYHFRPVSGAIRTVLYSFLSKNAFFYRVLNLILFYLFCVLIFFLIFVLTKDYFVALATSLLFCVHPINAFAIYYIPAHGDMLGGIFLILSVFSLIAFLRKENKKFYFISIVLFVSGLLCHEYNMIFPCHLLLISYFFGKERPDKKQRIFLTAPFFIISAVFLCYRIYATGFAGEVVQRNVSLNLTLVSYMASIAKLLSWYVASLISSSYVPIIWNINPVIDNIFLWNISLVAVVMFLFWLFFYWRKNNKSVALLWLLIGFIPILLAMFAIPSLGLVIEPHWFFFSSIGFFFLVAILIREMCNRFNKRAAVILLTIIVSVLFLRTSCFKAYWKDDFTYSKFWLETSPLNPIPKMRLAKLSSNQKKYNKALNYYGEILKDTSYQSDKIYHNIALIYIEQNNFDLAKKNVEASLKKNPGYALAYNALGTIYIREGIHDKAEAYFKSAIELDKFCLIAMLNLGDLYMMNNRTPEAAMLYERFLYADPYHEEREDALYKLALIYFNQNNYSKSSGFLEKLMKEFPGNTEAYLMYGNIAGNIGKFEEAISVWMQGSRVDPQDKRFEDNINMARKLLNRNKK